MLRGGYGRFTFHREKHQNAMKRFCLRILWSYLNVLTFFPPDWGMLKRSRRVHNKQEPEELAWRTRLTEKLENQPVTHLL